MNSLIGYIGLLILHTYVTLERFQNAFSISEWVLLAWFCPMILVLVREVCANTVVFHSHSSRLLIAQETSTICGISWTF
jgi:cell division protein FtsL